MKIKNRFQGYLPIVVDLETGGVNANTDALLEIAAIFVEMDPETNLLKPNFEDTFHTHIIPFEGAHIEHEALEINKIDPGHPFRFAESEFDVLTALFKRVNAELEKTACRRAVLVGHNAHFDLGFLHAADDRTKLYNKNPFHKFTVFDTATLGAAVYGRSVLAKALHAAKISFNKDEAHSALYDAQKTAELFCKIINGIQKSKN